MPLPKSKTILTREGYEEIKKKLEEAIKVKRPAVVTRIRNARHLGDLKENFDYHDAKRSQALLHAKIMELQAILNSATVVEPSNDGEIDIGSRVLLKDLADDVEETYLIVGPAEADPTEGKISNESTMGNVLLGRKSGDRVTVNSPGGVFEYEVISVS